MLRADICCLRVHMNMQMQSFCVGTLAQLLPEMRLQPSQVSAASSSSPSGANQPNQLQAGSIQAAFAAQQQANKARAAAAGPVPLAQRVLGLEWYMQQLLQRLSPEVMQQDIAGQLMGGLQLHAALAEQQLASGAMGEGAAGIRESGMNQGLSAPAENQQASPTPERSQQAGTGHAQTDVSCKAPCGAGLLLGANLNQGSGVCQGAGIGAGAEPDKPGTPARTPARHKHQLASPPAAAEGSRPGASQPAVGLLGHGGHGEEGLAPAQGGKAEGHTGQGQGQPAGQVQEAEQCSLEHKQCQRQEQEQQPTLTLCDDARLSFSSRIAQAKQQFQVRTTQLWGGTRLEQTFALCCAYRVQR